MPGWLYGRFSSYRLDEDEDEYEDEEECLERNEEMGQNKAIVCADDDEDWEAEIIARLTSCCYKQPYDPKDVLIPDQQPTIPTQMPPVCCDKQPYDPEDVLSPDQQPTSPTKVPPLCPVQVQYHPSMHHTPPVLRGSQSHPAPSVTKTMQDQFEDAEE